MGKPLVVLVADSNMGALLKGLFQYPQGLGIRLSLDDVDVFVHQLRDPGVYRGAHEFLRPYTRDYEYALVLFDREGCGVVEGKRRKRIAAQKLQEEVRKRLEKNGWAGHCQVVVIDPELEIWVWNASPSVAQVLQISPQEWQTMFRQGKPDSPKEALESLLEKRRIPRSSSLYEDLARTIARSEA